MSTAPHMNVGIHLNQGLFKVDVTRSIPVVTIRSLDGGYPELSIYPPTAEHAEAIAAALRPMTEHHWIGARGFCPVCEQYAEDCTGKRPVSSEAGDTASAITTLEDA